MADYDDLGNQKNIQVWQDLDRNDEYDKDMILISWYDVTKVSQDHEHDDEYTKICVCRPGYMKLVMMILVIKDIQVSSTPKSLLPVESVLLDNCTAEHYHLKLGHHAIITISNLVTLSSLASTLYNQHSLSAYAMSALSLTTLQSLPSQTWSPCNHHHRRDVRYLHCLRTHSKYQNE